MRLATCACGQLRAACSGDPVLVALCHCVDCQRRTGSAFGVAAFYPREAVATSGEASRYQRASDSGRPVDFRFCPACGSTVFWEPGRKPDVIAVALGAFADAGFPGPTREVYPHRRHPWVAPLDRARFGDDRLRGRSHKKGTFERRVPSCRQDRPDDGPLEDRRCTRALKPP